MFYTRLFGLTELGNTAGDLAQMLLMSKGSATHQYLWPNFQYVWPLLKNPNPAIFPGPEEVIGTWGIPALNTIILLSSAVTVTWAHWGLKKGNRRQLIIGLILTIILGFTFEGFQVHEYICCIYGTSLDACEWYLWHDILHVDRVTRHARDDWRHHANYHSHSLSERTFPAATPFRI